MAETPKQFTIVKFTELPIKSMKDTECVPTSWIKKSSNELVAVKYPDEMTRTNKSLLKNGKDPLNKWDVYWATIVGQLDNYKEWEVMLLSSPGRAPQTPLAEQLENLTIGTPLTSKEPRKPKNLQEDLNTPDAAVASANTAVQVDEELLEELYRTWEHMNLLMKRIFKPENQPK